MPLCRGLALMPWPGMFAQCTLAALLEARTIPTKASKPAGRASLESTAPQAPAKLHAKVCVEVDYV